MTARLDADDKACGCGRVHTPAQWATLDIVGMQPDYAGGALELRNCHCGSTLSVPVGLDDDTAGRVIDAAAPWVRRLTAVVVRGTEPTTAEAGQ